MSQNTASEPLRAGALKTWFLETRPQFLLLSVVLGPIGAAIAWYEGTFDWLALVLAWVGVILAHVAVNVLNDYFDWKSGLDFRTRRTPFSGGSGILTGGLLEPKKVYWLGVGMLAIDAAIALYFCLTRGWALLPVVLLGGAFAYFYTPYLSHWAIGEVAAGLGLGSLVVLGAYFVQTGAYSWPAVLASLGPGFLTANLLLLNEFPDLEADQSVGRRNLVMRLGRVGAARLFAALLVSTYASVVVGILAGLMPVGTLVVLLTTPLAYQAVAGTWAHLREGAPIEPALGANVMTILATNLLLTVGYLLSGFLGL
ncbi:MAG: prenyltransferase [Anaerolineae bacterium]